MFRLLVTVNACYFVTFLELKSQDLNTAERVSHNRFSYRGVHKIYNLESYTSASLFFSRFVFHNLRSCRMLEG